MTRPRLGREAPRTRALEAWPQVTLGPVVLLALSSVAASSPGGEGPTVRSVEIEGVPHVDHGAIIPELSHYPPRGILFWRKTSELDETSLELDRRRIESFYRWQGYFSARVVDIDVDVDEDGAHIHFEVDPGPPSLLVDLDLDGVPSDAPLDPIRLLRDSKLKIGQRVLYASYEDLRRRVRNRVITSGYVHAEVEGAIEVLEDAPSARIQLRVDSGPPTHFGPVRVRPGAPVPESSIRARIAWEEGERFDPDLVELTEGRLYQLGMIGSVQFDWPSERSGDPLPITISTRPATPRELKLGGGLARDNVNYEVRLRGAYRQANFFHPLNTLRLELKPAFVFRQDLQQPGFNIEALAELARDDFLVPRVTGTVGVGYRLNQFEAFQTTGPHVGGSLTRAFALDRLKVSLAAEFEYLWMGFDDVRGSLSDEEQRAFGLFDTLPITTIEPSIAYDARDNPRRPRRGWFARTGVTYGYVAGASSSSFVLVDPELRGYVPLGDRVVLAARARLGTSVLPGGSVPAPRRYFGGGAQSQRGFANRRLAPSVENSDGEIVPLGGEALVEVSGEVRVHLFEVFGLPFGVVAFGDGADVQTELSEIRFPGLHWALGGGLRLQTPVGPIRFDVGYRVTRPDEIIPTDSVFDRIAWHIAIGEAF